MDTLVIFDHVLVPRNRIFLYGNSRIAEQFLLESNFHAHVSHQVLCRQIAKIEFFLGLVQLMVVLNGPTASPAIEQVAEISTTLEILKSLLIRSEENAVTDKRGILIPHKSTMLAANSFFSKVYSRIAEIVQTLASSKLIMLPSEADFKSDASTYLNQYLKMDQFTGHDVRKVYRLAWELSTSSFAGRQIQYERFFFGGPNVLAGRLYTAYSDRMDFVDRVIQFLGISLPNEEL